MKLTIPTILGNVLFTKKEYEIKETNSKFIPVLDMPTRYNSRIHDEIIFMQDGNKSKKIFYNNEEYFEEATNNYPEDLIKVISSGLEFLRCLNPDVIHKLTDTKLYKNKYYAYVEIERFADDSEIEIRKNELKKSENIIKNIISQLIISDGRIYRKLAVPILSIDTLNIKEIPTKKYLRLNFATKKILEYYDKPGQIFKISEIEEAKEELKTFKKNYMSFDQKTLIIHNKELLEFDVSDYNIKALKKELIEKIKEKINYGDYELARAFSDFKTMETSNKNRDETISKLIDFKSENDDKKWIDISPEFERTLEREINKKNEELLENLKF